MAIRRPHCGSPVVVRGRWRECGCGGDGGKISSLHSSEKAKLLRAAAPSVDLMKRNVRSVLIAGRTVCCPAGSPCRQGNSVQMGPNFNHIRKEN